jgi:hypothetical protein
VEYSIVEDDKNRERKKENGRKKEKRRKYKNKGMNEWKREKQTSEKRNP